MNDFRKDPLNILVAGVGGQGNVMMAQVMGQALVKKGYHAVIGDTFGASQRGGSVASHIRISKEVEYSSIVPKGHADLIIGMEPSEALRVMAVYANPETRVICNPRPVYPPTVISGSDTYPDLEELINDIEKYCGKLWIIEATDEAMAMGNGLYANTILMGAVLGANMLPINRNDILELYKERFTNTNIYEANVKALDRGIALARVH